MPSYFTFGNSSKSSDPTPPNTMPPQANAESSFRANMAGFKWAQGVRLPIVRFDQPKFIR